MASSVFSAASGLALKKSPSSGQEFVRKCPHPYRPLHQRAEGYPSVLHLHLFVEPALLNMQILGCFSRFATKSTLALYALHVHCKIALLDVRTFNTCFILAGDKNS
jgi:hypothetical protein